ncbi:MAG: class I SAM-dependent methyltransferase [Flavobacteriaceae bacterium]|nr:class I SAM-dependent methyltransferase [Flavobacteriaceae bacterium]MDG1962353.1 class I SAM-dependent methyltransferase [Flavobacteriaceae bacterium]
MTTEQNNLLKMDSVEKTIAVNLKQKEFYNHKNKNLPSRFWSYIREKSLKKLRRELGILSQCYDLHKEWMGDLSHLKVLDLGCYEGNALSLYLAENSKAYIGIDLSDNGIKVLNTKLSHLPNARGEAVDFLSEEFRETDFDLIYAYGVLHHFKDVEMLAKKLSEKLKHGGKIIAYDPLKTSFPIWIIRSIYRPFQSDAAWEFPFGRKTLRTLNTHFQVLDKRGVMGISKYYFIVQFLPLPKSLKTRFGKKAHDLDWKKSAESMKHLYLCMQVNLLLQKSNSTA